MKKLKNLIGISIENDEISLFQDTGSNVVMKVKQVPESILRQGKIIDEEALAQMIGNTVRNGGFKGRNCALVLPEYGTYFRNLKLPPMSGAELKLNLPYEFRDFVGNDSNAYFYDYAIDDIKYKDDVAVEMNLFAGAVRKSEIAFLEKLLKSAGLRLKLALPKEMALINLFRRVIKCGYDAEKEFCIVDIGHHIIHVYIIQNAKIYGSKVIYMGGADVDRAIALNKSLDLNDAIRMRIENTNNILDESFCKAVYDDIAVEVMKAINFHRFENPESQVEDIHFCGTDSGLFEIRDAILDYLKFRECDIAEILPEECKKIDDAYRGILSIGVVLHEGSEKHGRK